MFKFALKLPAAVLSAAALITTAWLLGPAGVLAQSDDDIDDNIVLPPCPPGWEVFVNQIGEDPPKYRYECRPLAQESITPSPSPSPSPTPTDPGLCTYCAVTDCPAEHECVCQDDQTGQCQPISKDSPTPSPTASTTSSPSPTPTADPLDLIVPEEITVTAGQIKGDIIRVRGGQDVELRIVSGAGSTAAPFCQLPQ